MASGIAIGGLAQGLAQGLQSGIGLGKAIQDKERFELELPGLQANAEKAKADLAFQQDFQKNMAGLMTEAKGRVIELEDGTTQSLPGMDPLDVQLRAAEIMKESMFRHGKLDFAQLKAARDYGKELQSEGVLEAMRYAMANPQDQAGIRAMFNKKGKLQLGDDIQIGVENGDFGPTVVGYKVGADGKQVKAFDGTELLMPYLGAATFAQMAQQTRLAQGKEKGDDRRTAMTVGASNTNAQLGRDSALEIAKLGSADRRYETDRKITADANRETRAGQVTPKDEYTAFQNSFNTVFSGLSRELLDPNDKLIMTKVYSQAKARAVDILAIAKSTGKKISTEEAIKIGLEEAIAANPTGTTRRPGR
jgi:hypothetical protein